MYPHSPNVTSVKDVVDLGCAERVSVFERVKRIAGQFIGYRVGCYTQRVFG